MDEDLFALMNSLNDHKEVRDKCARQTMGYPGSKHKSLDHILPCLPYTDSYAEPFGGSGAVMLARNASNLEVFNDRCSGITAFYRCLRDPIKRNQLAEKIELTVHSREEFERSRDTYENVADDIDRAFRWSYAVHMSFSKLGRSFGRATRRKAQHGQSFRTQLQWFQPVHERLLNVQIENLDWRQILRDYDSPSMVWYLDPPYVNYAKGLYRHEMQVAEHKELMHRISHLQGFVALSGYNDKQTLEIYGNYHWDHVKTWTVHSSMLGQSYTEENYQLGTIHKRGNEEEILFIKEFS